MIRLCKDKCYVASSVKVFGKSVQILVKYLVRVSGEIPYEVAIFRVLNNVGLPMVPLFF